MAKYEKSILLEETGLNNYVAEYDCGRCVVRNYIFRAKNDSEAKELAQGFAEIKNGSGEEFTLLALEELQTGWKEVDLEDKIQIELNENLRKKINDNLTNFREIPLID